jgi:hypothetical protein
MRREFLRKLPLGCVLFLLLPALRGDGFERADACAEDKETTTGLAWVCPYWKYADWGGYCSYYAEQCTGVFVSLDAPCNIPLPGKCMSPFTNCIQVNTFKARTMKHPGQQVHPDIKKGLKNKPSVADGPLTAPGTKVLRSFFVKLQIDPANPAATADIKLFLLEVEPPKNTKGHVLLVGHGREVTNDKGASYDATLPHSAIVGVDDHVCWVQLNSVTYQVVVHENTTVKAP